MRRLLMAAAVSVVGAGLGTSPALAWNSWCDDEPPVTVVTPAGHHVTVNNWISVPVQSRRLLQSMQVTGDATPGLAPGTSVVHIHVLTPGGGAQYVRVTSSTARYEVNAHAVGAWGSSIDVDLVIPEG